MGATANGEPDSWLIEQAVQEYEAYCAGRLDMSVDAIEALGGQIQRCGSLEDEAHWTIAYVRDEDEAVLPLAVGERAQSLDQFARLDRADVPIWDRRYFPPPVVVVDGAPRHFRPARGRFLVGVAQLSRRAVLLVAAGESLAVVHVAGQARAVLFRGRPLSFREIDVDAMLRSQPSRGTRRLEAPLAVRPPAAVRAQHLRIVGAVPVDVGEGPSIASVLEYGFGALARRAEAVKLASKRKGKTRVREVLDALYQALLAGCDDFEGMAGEVLSQLRALGPELDLTSAVFADVLRLLHATGTCLVERPTPRRWRINLVGLTDPRSPLHRRFCAETQGLARVSETSGGPAPANGSPTTSPSSTRTKRATDTAPSTSPASELAGETPTGGGPPATSASETSSSTEVGPTASETLAEPKTREAEPVPVEGMAALPPDLVIPAPAAALAILYLGAKAALQREARAHALAQAVSQVERQELMTKLAIAAAERAKLLASMPIERPFTAPVVREGVSEAARAAERASEPVEPPPGAGAPASGEAWWDAPPSVQRTERVEAPPSIIRRRSTRPLFLPVSSISSPGVARLSARPSLAGLLVKVDEQTEVERVHERPRRTFDPLGISLDAPQAPPPGAPLGPRGPPGPQG